MTTFRNKTHSNLTHTKKTRWKHPSVRLTRLLKMVLNKTTFSRDHKTTDKVMEDLLDAASLLCISDLFFRYGRGLLARQLANRLREHRAATKIQAVVRGFIQVSCEKHRHQCGFFFSKTIEMAEMTYGLQSDMRNDLFQSFSVGWSVCLAFLSYLKDGNARG